MTEKEQRYFEVLLEDIKHSVETIAEGHGALDAEANFACDSFRCLFHVKIHSSGTSPIRQMNSWGEYQCLPLISAGIEPIFPPKKPLTQI